MRSKPNPFTDLVFRFCGLIYCYVYQSRSSVSGEPSLLSVGLETMSSILLSYERNPWRIPFLTCPWYSPVLLVTGSPLMSWVNGAFLLSTHNSLSVWETVDMYILLSVLPTPSFLKIGIYFAVSLDHYRHRGNSVYLGPDLVSRSSTQSLIGLLHYLPFTRWR